MSYESRLHDLYQLEFFGMKLGLQNITALVEHLGRPDRAYPTIHVAGTNGKGSVSAMLASVYQEAGKSVGLYTSPHLVDFRERIRINGQMIPQHFLVDFLDRCWPLIEEIKATFFETTTAMMFDYFAHEAVDLAVIETGLGGRLDSTNVLEAPLATVVTSIGYDHMAQLGNTLESIAREKAGIFKHGRPAVVNCVAEVRGVFEEVSAAVGAPLSFVSDMELDHIVSSPFPGAHQNQNVRTVLATLTKLPDELTQSVIERGIERTSEHTGLRGRLERFEDPDLARRGIELWLDVGHNEAALREICAFFQERGARVTVVIGLMADKDVSKALQALQPVITRLIAVEAPSKRAMSSSELAELSRSLGITGKDGGAVVAGLQEAISSAGNGENILLCGSHYVVGAFLQNFRETGKVYRSELHNSETSSI